jgi:two-component system response regulator MprA
MRQVMVVDDAASIRALLVDVLRAEGHAVSEASDGLAALEELAGVHPDLIVLDLMMPAMDGRAFAAACQSRTHGRKVPIMLMSASPRLWQMADQLRRFDVRGFMSKPFDIDIFVAAVDRLTAPAPLLATTG